jgi:GTPase
MQIQQAGQAAEHQQSFSTKMSEKHIRVAVVGNVDAGKR